LPTVLARPRKSLGGARARARALSGRDGVAGPDPRLRSPRCAGAPVEMEEEGPGGGADGGHSAVFGDPGSHKTPVKGAGVAGGEGDDDVVAGRALGRTGCLRTARPGDCCCAACLGCTGQPSCACAYCLGAPDRAAAVAFAGTRYTPVICGAPYPPLTSYMGADGEPVYDASDLFAAWAREDAAAMCDVAAVAATAESPQGVDADGHLEHHLGQLQQSLLSIQCRAQECRTAAVAEFAAERKRELVDLFTQREGEQTRSQPPEQCGGPWLGGRDEGYVQPEERSSSIPEVDPLWG
jgi:hypothetical protein